MNAYSASPSLNDDNCKNLKILFYQTKTLKIENAT